MPITLSYSYKTINKQKNIPYYTPLIKGLEATEQKGQLNKNTAVNFEILKTIHYKALVTTLYHSA